MWLQLTASLLLLAGTYGEETASCFPGNTWQEDCNTCTCTENHVVICTRYNCPPEPDVQTDGAGHDVTCIPGSRWTKGCSDCWCRGDGRAVCTFQGCPDSPGVRTGGYESCTPGSRWKQDCSDCWCRSDGRPVCDTRGCLTPPVRTSRERTLARTDIHPLEGNCNEGTTWENDCNTCRCLSGGRIVCTKHACLPPTNIAQGYTGIPTADKPCTPGDIWNDGCNDCFCTGDGVTMCGRMACHTPRRSRAVERECLPGARWKVDCNDCWCTGAGAPVCTVRRCLQAQLPLSSHSITPPTQNCTPGDTWKIECNDCMCTETGMPVCTRKGCHPPTLTGQRTASVPETKTCTPGDRWNDGCNDCWCNDHGNTMCTRRACLPTPPLLKSANDRCLPGGRWKDNCNDCWCNDQGNVVCTRKQCRPEEPVRPKCTPGTTYHDECNACRCTETGLSICTRLSCDATDVPGQSRAVRKEEDTCTPGARWNDGCNDCWCSEDGTTMCTRRACLSPRSGSTCVSGETWKEGCNECMCTEDGIPTCTHHPCLPTNETVIKPKIDPPATDVCIPGDRWDDGCNDCWCNDEGVTMCTLRKCLPDPQQADEACSPGARWNDGCNDCFCTDDAIIMCTRRACPPRRIGDRSGSPPSTEKCTPGTKWDNDCNICLCVNGVIVCSQRRCRPVQTAPAATCFPGARWKVDCNDCWCNEDGISMCTRRECLPTTATNPPQHYNSICYDPPIRGIHTCKNYTTKWTFNSASGQCERYFYGGCGGTDNLFSTEEACKKRCHYRDPICFLRGDYGTCRAYIPMISYNSTSGQCERYIYGGCGKTENLFDNENECIQRCANEECRYENCDWYLWRHYIAKQCKPIYTSNTCCPIRFDCSEWDRMNTPEKCFYHGRLYDVGVDIPEVTKRTPCRVNCKCITGSSGRATITCDKVECPHVSEEHHNDPSCIPQYSWQHCCPVSYSCPHDSQESEEGESESESEEEHEEADVDYDSSEVFLDHAEQFSCTYNNKTYIKGQEFYSVRGCKRCICGRNWNGDVTGPACRDIDCGLELQPEKLSRNCVPKYDKEVCCPVGFQCYEKNPCDDVECPEGEECSTEEVKCTQEPCPPPTPVCVPKADRNVCENYKCRKGKRCFESSSVCGNAPCLTFPACMKPVVCRRPVSTGPCRLRMRRFYFNTKTKRCEKFYFSGCGGNVNRFRTWEECQDFCSRGKVGKDRCSRPKDSGPCFAYIPSYFYNPRTNKCEQFIYGGCMGNENRFSSKKDCLDECGDHKSPKGYEPKCFYGDDIYEMGEVVYLKDLCYKCTCSIPPTLSCWRTC